MKLTMTNVVFEFRKRYMNDKMLAIKIDFDLTTWYNEPEFVFQKYVV